jgi:hypothetical protein
MNRRFDHQERVSSAPLMPLQGGREKEASLSFDPRSSGGIVRRQGVAGWWLNLTAPPWPDHPIPIAERERLRKAELTSFSILAIFAFLIALVSNSLVNPATAQAVGLMAIFLIIAAFLNRTGRTHAAAYLVPSVLMLLLAAVIVQEQGLALIGLPIYDLFVIPIVLVSLTGNRNAPWIFAAIGIAFVVGSFLLEPHILVSVQRGAPPTFDEVGAELTVYGIWGMINRHVALLFFAALFGWMGARSVDNAIARADRAEEIARLEHAIAEQTRQLEEGIKAIQQTHVKVANGDFSARAPLAQDHILWQIAFSLNNMIQRLQRSAEAEHMLRRTKAEVDRLLEEIQRAKAGHRPLWPVPSGTPLDPLIAEIAGRR